MRLLIVDPMNAVIPGAVVLINGSGYSQNFRAGNDGRIAAELQPGIYSVLIARTGFAPSCQEFHVKGKSVNATIKLKLSKFGGMTTITLD